MDELLRVMQEIPVFIPGQQMGWDQVKAHCIIATDGTIVIKCLDPDDGERLVDYVKQGILLQCSFDYRMPTEKINAINSLYKKE